ncbi:MAG TPA: UDP-N-acetylmuramoyl-tripeptide--D-alanyl-D-alanine ligase [Nocardioidaceae bacterium]|nr:UDP-N-acetylmuramoyl-tripeptide--D-alanyl-D-alanine ligase [Nocardioidaceae bacterium]
MIPMTLAEVAEVVGGRTHDGHGDPGRVQVTGPAFVDSRAPEPGGLFVAVQGEHVDGHDFAVVAVEQGAAAVLASRPVDVPCVVVDDVVESLGRLASVVRDRLPDCRVVGLTGSQGKTTTKDVLAQILDRVGPTVATAGSYNNELGLPLTVLRADASTRHLVLEMGARHVGDIGYLAGLVRPDVAVVLNVGVAHLGEFGDREGIAQTKGELVEALDESGVAVLNADDPLVSAMASRTRGRVMTFGSSSRADLRITSLRMDALGRPQIGLAAAGESVDVALPLVGEHQAGNAAAAAAVALALGVPLDDVATALEHVSARSRWRMEVSERADGVTVVNDAYNANPDSMRAALKTLAVIGARDRRTVAVLGEMLELGPGSRDEHDAVGRLAVRLDVSRLVVVGEGAKPIHLGASLEGSWAGESVFVPDIDAALRFLADDIGSGDVVLVKASRGAGLERVAAALLDRPDAVREGAHG